MLFRCQISSISKLMLDFLCYYIMCHCTNTNRLLFLFGDQEDSSICDLISHSTSYAKPPRSDQACRDAGAGRCRHHSNRGREVYQSFKIRGSWFGREGNTNISSSIFDIPSCEDCGHVFIWTECSYSFNGNSSRNCWCGRGLSSEQAQ